MVGKAQGIVGVAAGGKEGCGFGPGAEAQGELASKGAAGEREEFGGVGEAFGLEGFCETGDFVARKSAGLREGGGGKGELGGEGGGLGEELLADAGVRVEMREQALGFG